MGEEAIRKAGRSIASSLLLVLLALFALVVAFPYLWMVLTSLKPAGEVFTPEMRLLPRRWSPGNYLEVLRTGAFPRYLLNSGIVTALGVALELVVSFLGAYAFARLRFYGREAAFFLVLGTLMIPPPVLMLPAYLVVGKLGWLDSYQGLIIPRAGAAFGIFLLRQFMLTVPRELEEAARIDGAGLVRQLTGLYLPLCLPSLTAAGIFSMIGFWNDYYWPLVVTTENRMRTLALGIGHFKSLEGMGQWELLMAAGTIATVPMLVGFLLARKPVLSSLSRGALHGGR